MISLKYAIVMAVGAFAARSLFAPPVQQAIAAVIATDVQCTGCVGTSDLAGNAVTAAKIKDNEVKAAEIAANSVGASEIIGVSKLIFAECAASESSMVNPNTVVAVSFNVPGADIDDMVTATINTGGSRFEIFHPIGMANSVSIGLRNDCPSPATFSS